MIKNFKFKTRLFAALLLFFHLTALAQRIVEYESPVESPLRIATGMDGNLWFTGPYSNIGKITTAGAATRYMTPTLPLQPYGITQGSDGNIWFTARGSDSYPAAPDKIGKITPAGIITEYPIPTINSKAADIVSGPDGNLWFTEWDPSASKIGKITLEGVVTEYSTPTKTIPWGITKSSDGNLWFTEYVSNQIAKISIFGAITEYKIPRGIYPIGITEGVDKNLWFTVLGGIVKKSLTGDFTIYAVPGGGRLDQIMQGPDGNIWFTQAGDLISVIGKITADGVITQYVTPTYSNQLGGITAGPDGNIWFTETFANKIGVLYLSYNATPSLATEPHSGSVTPSVAQTVEGGSSTTFTLTPIPPYTNMAVTGTCGGTLVGNIFTTNTITHDCTVIANFTIAGISNIVSFTDNQPNGPTQGGTGVRIIGFNFPVGQNIIVKFGENPATEVTVENATTITANTPASSLPKDGTGAVDVRVFAEDGTTLLAVLPNGYTYRKAKCTVGENTAAYCQMQVQACIYVPSQPTTMNIKVEGKLITNSNPTITVPQCVDALPKFENINIVGPTFPNVFCTQSHPVMANRSHTPAACSTLATNNLARSNPPNLTMLNLEYSDASGVNAAVDKGVVIPFTSDSLAYAVNIIADPIERYKNLPSMQFGSTNSTPGIVGYNPQNSSAGFCIFKSKPTANTPNPDLNNYCLSTSLYSAPNGPWSVGALGPNAVNISVLNTKSTLI